MRIDAIVFRVLFDGCRQHERAGLTLPGRFNFGGGKDYDCITTDVAAGGLAVESQEKGQIGDHVIAYIEPFGRLEGEIVRRLQNGFALKIVATPRKIEALASQIASLARCEISGEPRAASVKAQKLLWPRRSA